MKKGEQIDGGKRNYGRGDAARCSKQLSQKKYSKKRKFRGNQSTQSKVSKTTTPPHKSKKCSKTFFYEEKNRWLQACRYGHSNIINCLACPKCFDSNMVVEENYVKKGTSILYIHCEFSKESYTSKTLKKEEARTV